MAEHRVAITGLGTISALGRDVPSSWDSIKECRSGIRKVTRNPYGESVTFPAAVVDDYDPLQHFTPSELLLRDTFSQYALIAAREAVRDAGLEFPQADTSQTAVVLGTGAGGEESREAAAARFFGERNFRCNPMVVPKTNAQASVGLVSMEFGTTGPAFTISTGCASATHAVAQAFTLVRHGVVTHALTGGSEASVLFSTVKAFQSMRVLSDDTCRPFSRGRSGMVLGEGAGVVVLERLDAALARGAKIYAELAGCGMSADAADPVHPTARGPAAAIRAALKDARLEPESVEYVNAHGTGTMINDHVENAALHTVFGPRARELCVSSTKSMHGHSFGGVGGIELVATALALRHGIIPPTANYLGRDESCDLDYVPNEARERAIKVAISNSFAFGGLNAVLALRRFD
jgi:nodulation protein E